MNCTDCRALIHAHLDSVLPLENVGTLELHLESCPACRSQLTSLLALRSAAAKLPRELTPPQDVWPTIEAQLSSEQTSKPPIFTRPWMWKLAACLALLSGLSVTWSRSQRPSSSPSWQIAAVAGAPRVGTKSFQGESKLHVGQWLETDTRSRARVTVGTLGEINVEPRSRIRLVETSPTAHRLELAWGTLSALIWAPPRLFFVETPSATAIDLGCAYTLQVDNDGAGLLAVTSGYVALQHDGRESVISAGQMCATRRGFGPGTPFASDASEVLRRALNRFDFEKSSPSALPEILAHARAADAVTLFHLLSRTGGSARGDVYDALAREHTPPRDVTRAGILGGDPIMLNRWADALGFTGFPRL